LTCIKYNSIICQYQIADFPKRDSLGNEPSRASPLYLVMCQDTHAYKVV
jgi:hypothetical protein